MAVVVLVRYSFHRRRGAQQDIEEAPEGPPSISVLGKHSFPNSP